MAHLKFLLIGESNVGKTSILNRFVDDDFVLSLTATIGIDFKVKDVQIDTETVVRIQVWDTAGQERYRTITNGFYRNTEVVFIVFDLTNRDTFASVAEWVQAARTRTTQEHLKGIYLVGSKCDCARKVTVEEANAYAITVGLSGYFEVSARDSIGVEDMFRVAAIKAYKRESTIQSEFTIKGESLRGESLKGESPKGKQNKCCV